MNDSRNTLISIIMPAHNASRFIGQAIESVLAQTYPDWELLIIDDASTDDTPDLVRAFSDPRIKYHRVERVGHPAGVRNIGLRLAQGEYIAFLDSDDEYLPQALEILYGALQEKPDATSAYGFCWCIDEKNEPIPERNVLVAQPNGTYTLPPDYSHSWKNIVLGYFSCLLPGLILRRSTLDRIGNLNEQLYSAEDYEFYVRLFMDNHDGLYCIPNYVYRYRIYSESLTKTAANMDKILASAARIMDWLFGYEHLRPEIEQYRSLSYTGYYRYFARERLLNYQYDLARYVVFKAFQNPNVSFKDWVKYCLPLLVRSYLPSGFNDNLVVVRRKLVYGFYKCCRPHKLQVEKVNDEAVSAETASDRYANIP